MDRLLHLDKTHPELFELIDNLNIGLLVEQDRGEIVYANRRLCGWLGYAPGELEGENVANLVPPELAGATADDLELIGKGDLRARLTMLRRRDFTTFPVVVIPTKFTSRCSPLAVLKVAGTGNQLGSK